jgi:16S rRNA (cytosine1402-N4)-methyltransferase
MISSVHFNDEGAEALTKTMSRYEYHESVLMVETMEALQPAPGKLFVDGTLGGGGHTGALLEAGARVIGLDQDPEALAFATRKLESYGDRFQPVRASFAQAGEVLDRLEIVQIDGALLDLGISSHQIDTPERGFSFQREGPLDMRMDPDAPITAASLVNTMAAEQLERIFRSYGEEPAARKIAARLVRDRLVEPFTTTLQLANAVEKVVPRRGKTHPATRVFQALRIAVNRELDVLPVALELFTQRLAPGGRFAVITFHSLEDRIVKQFFKSRAVEWLDRPEWPAPKRNHSVWCLQRPSSPVMRSSRPIHAHAAPSSASPKNFRSVVSKPNASLDTAHVS